MGANGGCTLHIKFGTDGWRGIIANDFTFENVAICAQGVADYIKAEGSPERGLLVGYDTRFGSREFAVLVAEVLAGNGINILLCDTPAPTPVVSYNVLANKTAGAVIITASHNPAQWNGFKLKSEYAGSASSETIRQLEEHIDRVGSVPPSSIPLSLAVSQGLVCDIDPQPPYVEQIKRLVDIEGIKRSGINVVVDSMHGAGRGYLPTLLQGSEGPILEIRTEVNPAFPGMVQPEPIAQNLARLSALVVERGADVGIAYDGDADRLGVIDEKGEYLSTLEVFSLLALYLLDVKGQRGPIVKSLTSSDMLIKLGRQYGVPVFETKVGFKYIGPLMIKENALMAGEESGGYGYRGHIPERDGILSSLLFLEFIIRKGLRPSELLQHLHSKVGEHHFQRRDIPFASEARSSLQQILDAAGSVKELGGMNVISTDVTEGRRFRFEEGWLAIRFSGTEPLVRIYGEADTPARVESLLDGAASMLGLAS